MCKGGHDGLPSYLRYPQHPYPKYVVASLPKLIRRHVEGLLSAGRSEHGEGCIDVQRPIEDQAVSGMHQHG